MVGETLTSDYVNHILSYPLSSDFRLSYILPLCS